MIFTAIAKILVEGLGAKGLGGEELKRELEKELTDYLPTPGMEAK